MDPFAALGISRAFDVDLAAIERTHRELSRALHPDRFVGAGASERRAALERAVEVNEAWRIVRDPIRRAEALLALHGVRVGEDVGRPMSAEFLTEMLEQREALSEAKQARDLERVREMARLVEARAGGVEHDISEGFARGAFASLAGKLGELRFCRRFLDEVSAIEDELESQRGEAVSRA